MKAYLVWLKTELKRVAKRLPSLFIGAIVLTALVGAIAFCALMTAHLRGEKQEVGAKVALVAPEDAVTDLAIQFVAGMDSVKEWCSFERYELEEGLTMLEEGKVVAVIELPEEMLASILDGRNIPAKLYLSGEESLGSMFLEVMAKAGISLLQVAQGEIYATTDLYQQYAFEDSLGSLYGEINLYNLDIALNREQLFKTVLLSETEGISMAAYFGATAISLMSLLFGLLVADLMLEYTQRDRMLHLSRVSVGAQVIGRFKVLTGLNFLWSLALLMLLRVSLFPQKGVGANMKACVGESLYLLLAVACVTGLYLLLGNLFTDKMSLMFVVGLGVIVFGYMGGYFVPSGLLGEQVKTVASFLPTTYMHRICSGVLSGQEGSVDCGCLLVWLVSSLCLSLWLRERRRLR